jgi:hypothetical protein
MLAMLLAAPFMAQADATIANAATPSIRIGLGASGCACSPWRRWRAAWRQARSC